MTPAALRRLIKRYQLYYDLPSFTQAMKAVAAKLRVSKTTVWNWLAGARNMSEEHRRDVERIERRLFRASK